MIGIGIVVIVAGLLVTLLGWLGKIGKLPRNHFAGIRLPSTMRSDRAWAAAHRAGGNMTMLASLFMVAMGIRIAMVGEEQIEQEAWWFAGPMLVLLVIGAVQGHRAAKTEYAQEQSEIH